MLNGLVKGVQEVDDLKATSFRFLNKDSSILFKPQDVGGPGISSIHLKDMLAE